MNSSSEGSGAFLTLVDVAKWYAGGWIVATALDQALARREPEPTVILVPAPVPPEPQDQAVLKMLWQVEAQVDELQAKIEALPTEQEPLRRLDLPRKPAVPTPQPVRRGSVEELTAAVRAYNEAARRLGLVILTGNLDDRVDVGEPEDADDAISGVIDAAEQLLLLGVSLARKADALSRQRHDLYELTVTSRLAEAKLPALLDLAEQIDGLLDDIL